MWFSENGWLTAIQLRPPTKLKCHPHLHMEPSYGQTCSFPPKQIRLKNKSSCAFNGHPESKCLRTYFRCWNGKKAVTPGIFTSLSLWKKKKFVYLGVDNEWFLLVCQKGIIWRTGTLFCEKENQVIWSLVSIVAALKRGSTVCSAEEKCKNRHQKLPECSQRHKFRCFFFFLLLLWAKCFLLTQLPLKHLFFFSFFFVGAAVFSSCEDAHSSEEDSARYRISSSCSRHGDDAI